MRLLGGVECRFLGKSEQISPEKDLEGIHIQAQIIEVDCRVGELLEKAQ